MMRSNPVLLQDDNRVLSSGMSRRDFLKTTAAASMTLSGGCLFAGGDDKIRVGVIGCGDRGIYDSIKCVKSAENIAITALADLFPERVERFREHFKTRLPDTINVTADTCFSGFDAYRKLLACDLDLVIMTQPPHFRPAHFRAAIEAGKHVFMEKPVAVDPAGVRSVMETAKLADQKKRTVVAGTQMRRLAPLEAIMKRIHNGDLGSITSGQSIRFGDGMMEWGPSVRDAAWSDMEWQIRRWLFHTWLSGDFIVEQHVHNLDLINWALNAHPVRCTAIGGRQSRTDDIYGDVYDHMAVEYVYPGDIRIHYNGAQMDRITIRNEQRLFGSKGTAYFDFGRAVIEGECPFEYQGEMPDPCLRQHADQMDAIRNGTALNQAVRVAESTMTAIMGRMSAYTGKTLNWNWVMNASKLDFTLPEYAFVDLPEPSVPIPGKTPLL